MLKKSLSLLAVLMFGFIGTAMAEEPEVLTTEVQEVQEVQNAQLVQPASGPFHSRW